MRVSVLVAPCELASVGARVEVTVTTEGPAVVVWSVHVPEEPGEAVQLGQIVLVMVLATAEVSEVTTGLETCEQLEHGADAVPAIDELSFELGAADVDALVLGRR